MFSSYVCCIHIKYWKNTRTQSTSCKSDTVGCMGRVSYDLVNYSPATVPSPSSPSSSPPLLCGYRHFSIPPSVLTLTIQLPSGEILARVMLPLCPIPTWVTSPSSYRQTWEGPRSTSHLAHFSPPSGLTLTSLSPPPVTNCWPQMSIPLMEAIRLPSSSRI